jgi:hypothetical protein|tara:strand:+ start:1483 stop:2727 length:1245 start_codon:yes stop_codon:yes gene_type:complete
MATKGISAFLGKSIDNIGDLTQGIRNSGVNLKAVRVTGILLNDKNPRFEELGGWNGLGTIEYQEIDNPIVFSKYPTAKPLISNSKQFPLINEIVYLILAPNTSIGGFTQSQNAYYVNVVSLWNHPHHNGFPSNPQTPPPAQQKDYQQTQAGSVRRVTDQSTEINLGNTFIERSNIHPLLPFEGDILQEGRWGNSIRFSSTIKNTQTGQSQNNWSLTGTSGDPITIIRNGQGNQTEEGWIPITEEINNNDASIYLTSTQSIPLIASSINYFSYPSGSSPTVPNQYTGKQVVLNSGRLMFNASEDHLLLSSAKSIGLSSAGTVNIDTPTFTVQTDKIYLGSKNATEPLMLGNSTVDLLRQLIEGIQGLVQILSIQVGTPPGTPLEPTSTTAKNLLPTLSQLANNLDTLTSKDNFTS